MRDSVQSGTRPVLILQNNIANLHSPTLIIAPLTPKIKKPFLPTHVILRDIPKLKYPSMILFEQIMTIDKNRILHYMGRLNPQQQNEVEQAIRHSIGDGGV